MSQVAAVHAAAEPTESPLTPESWGKLGMWMFLGLQAYEWTHLITVVLPGKGLTFTQHLFGTTFFVLTGFHGMHVTGGVIYLSCIVTQGMRGRYSRESHDPVEIVGLYWHFVDLVWILIFTFVYLL